MNSVPKTFQVKSFGCQMNVYDGERMAELLGADGMTAAADGEDADLVVLNTCHIREKAAEKVYSDIGRCGARTARKPLIALAGCVAQAEGAETRTRSPMIDMVVGPQAYHRLPEMVADAVAAARPVDTDMPAISKFDAFPKRRRARSQRLPHGAGRLRQVLHLLRRALHAWRRDLAPVDGHCRRGARAGRLPARARSRCSGRT